VDPIALAATALGAGLCTGLAVVGATVAAVDALRPAGQDMAPALGGPLYLLAAGTLGGIVVAGVVTWRLLAPVDSAYRRGGFALVSAFATVPLMQIYRPLHQALGRPALLGGAALMAALALLLARRARRARTA
jgi:hypothetical protein